MAEASTTVTYVDTLDEPLVETTLQTCRMVVSGFPIETTMKEVDDVVSTFSIYGDVEIENIGGGVALMMFKTPDGVNQAYPSSKKVKHRGKILTFYPIEFQDDYYEHIYSPIDENIIDPIYMNFKGNITHQIYQLKEMVGYKTEDIKKFALIGPELRDIFRATWPDCKIIVHGSVVTGTHILTDDVKCFLHIPYSQLSAKEIVDKIEELIKKTNGRFVEGDNVREIPFPIIRMFHTSSKTNVSLRFDNYICVYNSRMIKLMLGFNESFRVAAVVIRYWAMVNGLCGAKRVSSYAIVLMFIFYLQCARYVPPVCYLQSKAPTSIMIDRWNVSFIRNLRPKHPVPLWIPDLLGEFFEFYSHFNFERNIVTPYLGRVFSRSYYANLTFIPRELDVYMENLIWFSKGPLNYKSPMVVQDLFKLNNNLTTKMTKENVREFQEFCKFAFKAYEDEKFTDHKLFLKKILLHKPEIEQICAFPSTSEKEYIYPHFRNDVASWRVVMTENLITLLTKICKIKMRKLGNKFDRNSSKMQMYWVGEVDKPVWNRDPPRNYSETFLVTQRKISAAITRYASKIKEQTFLVTVWYMDGTRSLQFEIAYVDGNMMDFLKLRTFLQREVFHWLYLCTGPSACDGFLTALVKKNRR